MPKNKTAIKSITDTALFLRDGGIIHLSKDDVELLRLSFPDKCEECGHDPHVRPRKTKKRKVWQSY